MERTKHFKSYAFAIAGVLLLTLIDQYTKLLAIQRLKGQPPYIIIQDVFQLTYVENRGAAFGLLQGQRTFFLITGMLVLLAIILLYVVTVDRDQYRPLRICSLFVAAGAIGNTIDRVRNGFVVDFFYFELINFPVFNVADIYITVSMIMLSILILFKYKEEDLKLSVLLEGRSRKNQSS